MLISPLPGKSWSTSIQIAEHSPRPLCFVSVAHHTREPTYMLYRILLRELDGEYGAIRGDDAHRRVIFTRVRHLNTILLRPKHQRCTTE